MEITLTEIKRFLLSKLEKGNFTPEQLKEMSPEELIDLYEMYHED